MISTYIGVGGIALYCFVMGYIVGGIVEMEHWQKRFEELSDRIERLRKGNKNV